VTLRYEYEPVMERRRRERPRGDPEEPYPLPESFDWLLEVHARTAPVLSFHGRLCRVSSCSPRCIGCLLRGGLPLPRPGSHRLVNDVSQDGARACETASDLGMPYQPRIPDWDVRGVPRNDDRVPSPLSAQGTRPSGWHTAASHASGEGCPWARRPTARRVCQLTGPTQGAGRGHLGPPRASRRPRGSWSAAAG
jgi:hypothetical protein